MRSKRLVAPLLTYTRVHQCSSFTCEFVFVRKFTMSSFVSVPNVLEQYLQLSDAPSSARVVPREEVPAGSLIVKSLVWMYQKINPVLVVLSLDASVDKTKLAAHLRVSGPKHVRMATSEQVFSTTGQTVGNVSPVGHAKPVRTIVDVALVAQYLTKEDSDVTCYGGGGSTGVELAISLRELLAASNAEVADVSASSKQLPGSTGTSEQTGENVQ
jgi:prolyl-tRNA editing enzyme YbaK/EbsC (Cys-tRNA(Pro) deacylase)